jgi:hypothetical protein
VTCKTLEGGVNAMTKNTTIHINLD